MKIRRFYFTKESEWIRNVYRDDKDGPWCRYEDVKPLLICIEELEAKLKEAMGLALNQCPFEYGTRSYDDWWQDRYKRLAQLEGE